jgi:hypothetical protein
VKRWHAPRLATASAVSVTVGVAQFASGASVSKSSRVLASCSIGRGLFDTAPKGAGDLTAVPVTATTSAAQYPCTAEAAWNASMTLPLPADAAPASGGVPSGQLPLYLHVVVFEADRKGSRGSRVGHAALPLSAVGPAASGLWLRLADSLSQGDCRGKEVGRLHVQVQSQAAAAIPTPGVTTAAAPTAAAAGAGAVVAPAIAGRLDVVVVDAQGLRCVEKSQDPYVSVQCLGFDCGGPGTAVVQGAARTRVNQNAGSSADWGETLALGVNDVRAAALQVLLCYRHHRHMHHCFPLLFSVLW